MKNLFKTPEAKRVFASLLKPLFSLWVCLVCLFPLSTAQNTPPEITPPDDLVGCMNMTTDTLWFTATDADLDSLVLQVFSSNPIIVPDTNITLGGISPDYYLIIEPDSGETGAVFITIVAMDSLDDDTEVFEIDFQEDTYISEQPEGDTVCETDLVILNVSAEGSDLEYQWQKDGADLTGFSATQPFLFVGQAELSDAGTYNCIVTGVCGPAVSSDTISLVVLAEPDILDQPESLTLCEGDDGMLSIVATGSGSALSYQWFSGLTPVTGGDSSVLSLTNVDSDDQGFYACVITNGDSCQVISDLVFVTVDPCTNIRQEDFLTDFLLFPNPASRLVRINFAPVPATFELEVLGIDGRQTGLLLKNIPAGTSEIELKVGDLPAGVYMVRIRQEEKVMVKRFVKIPD